MKVPLLHKLQRCPASFFSGETSISGTVAGGGTTMPEFQNSTKLRKNYIFQILSSSSIHFSNYFSKKSNDAAQIYS
jgi:hypothetical protein